MTDTLPPLPTEQELYWDPSGGAIITGYTADQMLAYAAAAVAAESERCAKVCADYADALEKLLDAGGGLVGDENAIGCARALASKMLVGTTPAFPGTP